MIKVVQFDSIREIFISIILKRYFCYAWRCATQDCFIQMNGVIMEEMKKYFMNVSIKIDDKIEYFISNCTKYVVQIFNGPWPGSKS